MTLDISQRLTGSVERMRTNLLLRSALLAAGISLVAAACGDSSGSRFNEEPAFPAAPVDDGSDGTGSGGDTDIDLFGDDEPTVDRSGELTGQWVIQHYSLPDGGGLTNTVGDTPASIEFSADGTFGYHTGCNAGGGQWTATGTYYIPSSALDDQPEGQAIMLTGLEQTQRGCDGFLGEQDVDLPTHFRAATRFRIADDGAISLLNEFLLVATQS